MDIPKSEQLDLLRKKTLMFFAGISPFLSQISFKPINPLKLTSLFGVKIWART